MVAPKGPRCPSCGEPTDPAFKPCCSKRCKDVDLNRWLKGSYSIPVVEYDDLPLPDDEGDGRPLGCPLPESGEVGCSSPLKWLAFPFLAGVVDFSRQTLWTGPPGLSIRPVLRRWTTPNAQWIAASA